MLSRIFFDRKHLLIVEKDEKPIGFAHLAPSPGASLATLDWSTGNICMIAISHPDQHPQAAGELLNACESHLARMGSHTVRVGGPDSGTPFYLGLYRGSISGGVLASDTFATSLYRNAGYHETQSHVVMHRDLSNFRPMVDRKQRQIRREYNVAAQLEPTESNWWNAATIGQSERFRFSLQPRSGEPVDGSVLFWDLEPLASSWGVHAMGICDIHTPPAARRRGLATFLIGEALRQVHSQGVTQIESHVPVSNEPTIRLLLKLGFEKIDYSLRFTKELV